jgi:hypothetical protein
MSRLYRLLPWLILAGLAAVVLLYAGYRLYRRVTNSGSERIARLMTWFNDRDLHADWAVAQGLQCPGAPFIFPTSGYIGFTWDDSFRPGHRHQGIDVFGGELGEAQVISAYPGYLTRQPDWISTVIVRVPQDPLDPARQIWLYYTHMADKQGNSFVDPRFPPGTSEVYVEAGEALGRQGNYSGDPDNPVGVHLHFSIVKDDGRGGYTNELEFNNTLDPSPYLGLPLNARQHPGMVTGCPPQENP